MTTSWLLRRCPAASHRHADWTSELTAKLGDALFLDRCTREGDVGLEAATVLGLWWRLVHGVELGRQAYAGDAPYEALPDFARLRRAATAFEALPPQRRDAWFASHGDEVRTCSVHEPLPSSPTD